LEIQELLSAYSYAIDTRDWDALDEVFTPDAVIDYTEMGGTRGNLTETKAFLAAAMPMFQSFQHMVATTKLAIDGDTAQCRTICHNPMVLAKPDGSTHTFFCGLWYRDQLVRTPAGWRIKDRYEERSYMHNVPEAMGNPGGS
jgi:ketosteroid isomerase-like protein